MASPSKSTPDLRKLESASLNSCMVRASSESQLYHSVESRLYHSVEQQIEQSKCHWSELSKAKLGSNGETEELDLDEEELVADNEQVFRALQEHSIWGIFFRTFNDCGGKHYTGSMEVGEKFAEGGQAELFHARVTWSNPEMNENDQKRGREWVLKVFKKGTPLRHLQKQWPHELLQHRAEVWERVWEQNKPGMPRAVRHHCDPLCGILLEDGRFAFLLRRELDDLRTLIDRNMSLKTAQDCGPFSKTRAELIMYRIALGMNWLHNRNIVHRDLKASNVLVRRDKKGRFSCHIADFESSGGVVGTGFWRAPEILQALKEENAIQRHEVFSKEADVYAYGMTCYEILTGKFPFDNHPWMDYDLVLSGQRPVVPEYVDDWAHELLNRCWHSDPEARPSFREILNLFLAQCEGVRIYMKEKKRRKTLMQ